MIERNNKPIAAIAMFAAVGAQMTAPLVQAQQYGEPMGYPAIQPPKPPGGDMCDINYGGNPQAHDICEQGRSTGYVQAKIEDGRMQPPPPPLPPLPNPYVVAPPPYIVGGFVQPICEPGIVIGVGINFNGIAFGAPLVEGCKWPAPLPGFGVAFGVGGNTFFPLAGGVPHERNVQVINTTNITNITNVNDVHNTTIVNGYSVAGRPNSVVSAAQVQASAQSLQAAHAQFQTVVAKLPPAVVQQRTAEVVTRAEPVEKVLQTHPVPPATQQALAVAHQQAVARQQAATPAAARPVAPAVAAPAAHPGINYAQPQNTAPITVQHPAAIAPAAHAPVQQLKQEVAHPKTCPREHPKC